MKRIIFDVPRWHLFLHRQARGLAGAESDDDGGRLFEDELFDRLYEGDGERIDEGHGDGKLRAWAEKVHDACTQLPSFTRLAAECRGDADAAALGVESLLEELGDQKDLAPDDRLLRRALSRGCATSSARIEELRESKEGLAGVSFGSGPGAAGTSTSVPGSLAARLRHDERLQRIALLAGRFKRIAAQKHRQRTRHGADEIVDVETGADLARLLPAELARLGRPGLRLAFLRDLTERRCLQYRMAGSETLGRGPLVVCLDKSDSMEGLPDVWATAVALALLDVAQRERRSFAVLGFNTAVTHEAMVRPGELLPIETLTVSTGGGTDIGVVLDRAVNVIRSEGAMRKADIVLITDGESDKATAPRIRSVARDLDITILGFGIGVDAAALAPWCDETQIVQQLDRIDDGAADSLFVR